MEKKRYNIMQQLSDVEEIYGRMTRQIEIRVERTWSDISGDPILDVNGNAILLTMRMY